MDCIGRVKGCLQKWQNGGEAECRAILKEAHANLNDPLNTDALAASYQALFHSVLQSWSGPTDIPLDAGSLPVFVQSVLAELPSTSSVAAERPRDLVAFGELVVDLIWATDSELDEILADSKVLLQPDDPKNGQNGAPGIEKTKEIEHAKRTAESDKEKLALVLKKLVLANIVDHTLCRERLDTGLLTSAGLIPDKTGFDKKEIRTRTGLFYKQNKFNLLREQSEGYTKVTTDLISNLGPANDPSTALPIESFQQVQERASAAWRRVVGLIGSFDLDPNRVLDIILDIFSVNLATHWHFFLALLASSPWVGEHTHIRDWNAVKEEMTETTNGDYDGKSLDEILCMAESLSTTSSASPLSTPTKPKVLAQVLGFKFKHYQSPETKVACTRGLYLVTALLIREKFVSLDDLYPHLGPADDDMPTLRQVYLDSVQERIKSSSNNLLAMAAPLESGSSSKPKVAAEATSPEVKEAPAQKAMIVVALLSVGDLRPALALLTKYPWLVDVQKDIADLLLRVLKFSITQLYDKLCGKERNQGFFQSRSRYASPGKMSTPIRKCQLTLCAPPPPSTLTHDCIFFFPPWTERIPICHSLDDLMHIVEPIMRLIGVYISREPLFLTKFLRIGKLHLNQSIVTDTEDKPKKTVATISEPENSVQEFWLSVARRHLLPALSMMAGNALCTVEVWNILRHFDMTLRWRLYGEWRDASYKKHPELGLQRILRERDSKGILRRLSSQTVESLAGKIAKLAHTNPCLFFTNAVNQIQAYDNLADVVIQALRFTTNMGFDVLVFIVIDALANPNKERLKEDGANASDWLQSLATFTGALFRRYSTDLSSVLKYIVHQLYAGQTSEIIVLEKLILKMAGIEPLPSLSDLQLAAMAGGPTLRIEAVASDLRGAGLEASEVSLKGTQRLGKTLIDTGLAFPILVQVAQQRQACVFKAKDAYLKSMAYLYDATHGVLFQYLELLSSSSAIAMDEYRKITPSLVTLVKDFGVNFAIAMQILRPMLNEAIARNAGTWAEAKEAEKAEQAKAKERRLKAALAAKREPANQPTNGETDVKDDQDSNAIRSEGNEFKMEIDTPDEKPLVKADEVTGNTENKEVHKSPWIPELEALFNDCEIASSGNAYEMIGPGLFLTFWQLTGYDLYFPKEKYMETEKNLLSSAEIFVAKARQADRSSDKSIRSTSYGLRAQRDRYIATTSELKKERQAQEVIFRYTTENDGRMEREKQHWLSHVGTSAASMSFIQSFIEHCIQPRCLLSPMDAIFCARFIRTLHEYGTPAFHTLMCYNKLLGEHVKVVVFSCSENEARNYGRFLKGVLQDLYTWHRDETAYEAANRRKMGSDTILLPGLQATWSRTGPTSPDQLLKWSDFKLFMKKCHRRLCQAFTDCLKAGDFMRVYNAILVLKEIIEVFPIASVFDNAGPNIDAEMQRIVQTEERGDLKILARAYSSSLKKREKLWMAAKPAQSLKPPVPRANSAAAGNTTDSARPSPSPSLVGVPLGPRTTTLPLPTEKIPSVERPSSAPKLDLENIPRPEVVKRNRDPKPEGSTPELNVPAQTRLDSSTSTSRPSTPQGLHPSGDDSNVSLKQSTQHLQAAQQPSQSASKTIANSSTDLRKDALHHANGTSKALTSQLTVQTDPSNVGRTSHPSSPQIRDGVLSMAPPNEPSQTPSAQELRSSRRSDRVGRGARESTVDQRPSHSRRSESPPTRPGTRNPSSESRTSSSSKRGKSRRDRDDADTEDKKKSYADAPSRAERVLHREGRSDRSGRDRIPGSSTRDLDRERESERERGRDRDKTRDREREREKRERSEREPHRERERDKERRREREGKDRDRRHEDKDHDRERERKQSGSVKESESTQSTALPSREDEMRTRTPSSALHADDVLGKRRRPLEDESDRSSKRGSRHREERERDRRRTSEKERDPDRRHKEREQQESPDASLKAASMEQPDRPRGNGSGELPISTVKANPPLAPRAMAQTNSPRLGRGEAPPSSPSVRDPPREPMAPRERELDRSRIGRSDREVRTERNGVRTDRPDRTEAEPERADRADKSVRGEREWKMNTDALGSMNKNNLNNGGHSPSPSSLADRISAPGNSPGAGRSVNTGRDEPSDRLKRPNSERERNGALEPPVSAGSQATKGTAKKPRIDRNRMLQKAFGR